MPLSSTIALSWKKVVCVSVFCTCPNEGCLQWLTSFLRYRIRNSNKQNIHWDPVNFFKVDVAPNISETIGEKSDRKKIRMNTRILFIRDHTFADLFVIMKKPTRPINGLILMRRSIVVSGITYGPIQIPHLTLKVQSAASGASVEP